MSVTTLSSLSGLSVSQASSLGIGTATGALFVDMVTLPNNTDARATDWNVPPTEFTQRSTVVGPRSRIERNGAGSAGRLNARGRLPPAPAR